jgi:hypothetical protein
MKAAPNIPLEFVDLVKIDGEDENEEIAGISVSRTLDSDPEISDVAEPVGALFKAQANKKFRIDEPAPEGLDIEKIGKQTIRRYFENGKLVKSVVTDPDSLPHQTTYLADEPVLEKSLATIIGILPADQGIEELSPEEIGA